MLDFQKPHLAFRDLHLSSPENFMLGRLLGNMTKLGGCFYMLCKRKIFSILTNGLVFLKTH